MFIGALHEEQDKGNVNSGLIPASVYKAAIEHYSFNYLKNPLQENDEASRVDTNVERSGLRHKLTHPARIRETMIFFGGDSGPFIYKQTGHHSVEQFLRGREDGDWLAVKERWPNLQSVTGCGAGWKDWIAGLKKVHESMRKQYALESRSDDVSRVPAYYRVVCIDHPNTINSSTPEQEVERLAFKKVESRKPLTTLDGFK